MKTDSIDHLARSLSADSITATTAAGSGHPTSSMSAAHLMAVLFANHLRFDRDMPPNPANDRLVLSKGHAAPVLYAALAAAKIIDADRLTDLRRPGSPLEGHPVPGLPLIDAATGSLGQGLANGLGMAIGLRRIGSPARVWVVLGDSEMAEGSIWEAMALASHHGASNLTAIVDMNRLGQRGPTMYGRDADVYLDQARAFGWDAFAVDGHDPDEIDAGLARATESHAPAMVVANTVKGFGVSFLADQLGRHGKALDEDEARRALEELSVGRRRHITLMRPPDFDPAEVPRMEPDRPSYTSAVATRDAFGDALAAHATADERLIVLDGEVSDSTRTGRLEDETPDALLEMYIAEQAMVGAAVGLAAVGFRPVVATFAAFLTRAHDFLRMAAIGRSSMLVVGSHAGVSIGQDGPSQMGLDDLAMMRAIPGSTVLYPADGNATVSLLELAMRRPGITYLRTTRGATPRQYDRDHVFEIGGSSVLRSTIGDVATLVAAGASLFEALEAADTLAASGTPVRVVDSYSVQPIDRSTLRQAMIETGRVLVVEDHWHTGGLGDAASEATGDLPQGELHRLAVSDMPGSADPQAQRRMARIDAGAIVAKVRSILGDTTTA